MRGGWASAEEGRKADDYQPDMPPFDGPEDMLGYFFEVGPVMSGAMGSGPITHGELQAWQRNTGVRLSAWQARALRRLSIEYLNEQHRAETLGCAPPWKAPDFKPEKTALQLSILNLDNT